MRFGDRVSLVLSLDTYEPVLKPDGLSVSACRTVCGHTQFFQVLAQKQRARALAQTERALVRLRAPERITLHTPPTHHFPKTVWNTKNSVSTFETVCACQVAPPTEKETRAVSKT